MSIQYFGQFWINLFKNRDLNAIFRISIVLILSQNIPKSIIMLAN